MRQISASGAAFIQAREALRLVPYQDGAGVWTDGWGNTHAVVPHGPEITLEKATEDFAQNLDAPETAVNDLVRVALSDNQFAALVSFAFNAGVVAFAGSALLRLLNDGQYEQVPAQLLRWDKEHVDGQIVVSAGLLNRRNDEIALWNTP